MGLRSLSLLFLVAFAHVQLGRGMPSSDRPSVTVVEIETVRMIEAFGMNETKKKSPDKTDMIQDYCLKNGGPSAYDNLKTAVNKTMNCWDTTVISGPEMEQDFGKFMRTYDVSFMVQKYCAKSAAASACSVKTVNALESCMKETEKMVPRNVKSVIEALNDFMCLNGGDDFLLFPLKGGIGCLIEKEKALDNCTKILENKYTDIDELEEGEGKGGFSLLKLGENECEDILKTHECAIKELKTCESPYPVKYIQSMFEYVNKRTPCNAFTKKA